MFWMSDIVRGKTRPRSPSAFRCLPRGQPQSSDSPQHLPGLVTSTQQQHRHLGFEAAPASGSKTSVGCCEAGEQTLGAEEEDATTITRQRTTDQTTERDRVGQTQEFLGGRQKQKDFSSEDSSSNKMSRNIERPSPKTYHITTLHNTAFYVTHDTFIGELFPPKIVKHILGFSGGTKGDGEVKRNWKPRYQFQT